jgi:hypothetical protein
MSYRSVILFNGFIGCLAAIILLSCSEEKTKEKEVVKTDALFTVLNFQETGLNFNNKLDETTTMNGFYYEYFYNGAGLAVADFNNDGLQDIYFVSNLRTNKLYLNQGALKFKNVSVKAKAQGNGGFSTGVTVVDINNDGLMDIYVLKSGRFKSDEPLRNELLINKGMGKDNVPVFEENASAYGLDLPHHSTQASFFDYDRDGDLDMFLINHNVEIYEIDDISEVQKGKSDKIGEKLFRNDNGMFVNVTDQSGIISNNLGFGLAVAVGDVNNDGWPDVYTSNDYYEKDHLYLNNQDGTFAERSRQSFNHISTFSMGSDIADINNDGLLDIISLDMMAEDNYTQKTSMSGMNVADFYGIEDLGLHRQYMYNALQLNNGVDPDTEVPVFSDIAQIAGVSSTDWSWAPLLFDMDNDGYRDLFVSNGIKRDFRNNDFLIYLEQKYREGVKKKKVDLTTHVEDLLEKLPQRPKENYLFVNKGDLSFEKLKIDQPSTYSNGAAYADFDNDGDLDIVVNNTDDFAQLYRNDSKKKAYLDVTLEGPDKNIDGIGARVELMANSKTYYSENYFTRGFQSAMAIPQHFGLGNTVKIDSIRIIWPDGKSQVVADVTPNQELKISYLPTKKHSWKEKTEYTFQNITNVTELNFKHSENEHDDFAYESLIPHKMSQFGPALSVADINNDGLEDFFIGGASGQAGVLYLQSDSGTFKEKFIHDFDKDKKHEDTGAQFFDADNDGDQDLYVVSGGNEKEAGNMYYRDRFYENIGNGNFKRNIEVIPNIVSSGQVVIAGDFDKDNDLDLFIGSRHQPMKYGYSTKSFLLENVSTDGKIEFRDVTEGVSPDLVDFGMVTDALWVDIDSDNTLELIVAQEWGNIAIFKYANEKFVNASEEFGTKTQIGWWYGLAAHDIDNDGDLDLIAGNLGLNYKYKATEEEPFHLYVNDFDKNKSSDIVLGYEQDSKVYPLRGRECTSNQMPFVKKKFQTYEAFAKASLVEVYGKELDNSIHKAVNNFASGIFNNNNNEGFEFRTLPNEVQISSINKIIVTDVNKDNKQDLVLFGNLYGSEVETPRNDASYGHFLKGLGDGNFEVVPSDKSGLFIRGDVRGASLISIGENSESSMLVGRNNDSLLVIKMKE